MAIKQTNIFPIDLQPRNAVGLSFPFSNSAVSGSIPFKLNYTTRDQIKSNIIVYLSTNKGERPLNPNYGGGLKNILFEQLSSNTLEVVDKIIRDELAAQFPEVRLKKLEILESPDENAMTVVMSYTVLNGEPDTLAINFNV